MSNKTTTKRHRHGPLKRKILAKSAAESEGVKDNGNLQQSPELTQGMLKILNDIYADPEKIGAKHLVDWFMTNGGEEPRRRYQAEVVNHFCHSNELQELRSNSSNISSRNSCLIDDRTSNGIVTTSNGNRKPLTSHGMYIRLVEKRFQEPPSNGGFKKPNTDRRLVFIMNPDSHALPYIGVLSKPQSLVTYELSFHLPFYSWKLTQHELLDIRFRRDGSPLRKVHNMSCLRGNSPTTPTIDYLVRHKLQYALRQWTTEFGLAIVSSIHTFNLKMRGNALKIIVPEACRSTLLPPENTMLICRS
ncbi:hypothetical protein DER46DRAFT_577803 [Fusarium sp. MPI-SDFR-AT-0072]|nr:hypothetical protein DER46DRAFT_577803 [Fusarium sp. MPI-SDFR-AT-0072]